MRRMTFVALLSMLGLLVFAPSLALGQDDLDCADFATQAEAQATLEEDLSDPHGLDEDADGIACETLPPVADDADDANGDDDGANGDDEGATHAPAAASQYQQYKKSVIAIPKDTKVLPDTGGGASPAALALGAGTLLLASGLVAGALVRRS